MTRGFQRAIAGAAGAAALASAAAGQTAPQHYAIPPQPLDVALRLLAHQADITVAASSALTAGKQSAAVVGDLLPRAALDRMLAGTDLHIEQVEGTFVVRPDDAVAPPHALSPTPSSTPITVTGSRIRGAVPASPVIVLDRSTILNAGQATIGDALRSLPQNYSGGQNPGVTLGAQSADPSDANATGGSAINLRGLGPDATLTLLNGHRVAYDGSAQGVDISQIPLAALDRVEIVADGASALYGSDAVAGVANIILRKDYDGISLTARGGLATEGGDRQQQYSAVGGKRWSSGGFIATYSYEHDTPIEGSDRDYTRYLIAPNSLLPSVTSHSAVVSGHQDIGSLLTFSVDGTFNQRWNDQSLGLTTSSSAIHDDSMSYSVTPTLAMHPGAWAIALAGTYGRDEDKSFVTQTSSVTQKLLSKNAYCLCNTLKSAELNGEGPLLALPGGTARLAVGGGYREDDYDNDNYTSNAMLHAVRKSSYAYGELFVPIIGRAMDLPLLRRLSFTGAFRYEHYDDLGGITTPKLGLIYTPVDGLDFKASWGRSFKAPELSQEYTAAYAYLYPIRAVGGASYPITDAALVAIGGGGTLKPERATSWTTTAELRPVGAPRFHAVASYFHIDYRDRIIQPANIVAALSSPIYADFVTYMPTLAEQQKIIGQSVNGLTNFTGASYNPGTTVAIVDDYYTNVAAQTIHGIDLQADYHADLAGGDLALTAQASWLDGRQRNTPQAPATPLAGTVFNPPHFRARAGFIWTVGQVTGSSFFNYIGAVDDIRQTPATDGSSMATIDMALRWQSKVSTNGENHLEIALAVQNIADERPPYLRSGTTYYVPYDSTNYSAIGRTVALSVTTRF